MKTARGLVLLLAAFSVIGASTEAERPNILFVLADDLAWSDLDCYGHPWHDTPHLDTLASEGIRFTDAYAAAPICSASRAAILTGKTPARLKFEFVTKDKPGYQPIDADLPLRAPPFTLNLPLEEITIPEVLSKVGYQTAFFGKWHVSQHHNGYLGWSPTHGPKAQGFEIAVEDFGNHPYSYRKKGKPEPVTESGGFPRDSMTDRACDFLRSDHGDKPFFLMASHFYVHTPVDTPCQWLLKKYEKIVPKNSPNRDKRISYAAFVETLDHHVGQLLTALDEAGHRDNTLVVFTSDNGGHPEYTANSPLRGSKWNLYEGGIRVPLITRWPNQMIGGQTNRFATVGTDLLPTFAGLAGASDKIDSVDGENLNAPTANWGRFPIRKSDLIWHFPYYHPEKKAYAKSLDEIGIDDFAVSKTRPQSAIRSGRFKLLYFYDTDTVELYDFQTDPGEQNDLSETQPDKAADLRGRLEDYLDKANARLPERVR